MNRQVGIGAVFTFLLLLAGLALHLLYPKLIEYKYDEDFMYRSSQGAPGHERFPALGMPSGAAGLVNPGLSVWVFSAPAVWLGIRSPPGLSRLVGLSFIGALLLLLIYVLRSPTIPNLERQAWVAAIGLSAVNPSLLFFTRKIWAQSLLPIFSVAIFILWMERQKRPAWRVPLIALCVLIGQIHMSGFFLGAALVAMEARDTLLERRPWTPLLIGIFLGSLPMIPWLQALFSTEGNARLHAALGPRAGRWPEMLKFRYWGHVAGSAAGLDFSSILGRSFKNFAGEASVATLLALSVLMLLGLGIATLRKFAGNLPARLVALFSLRSYDGKGPVSQLLWIGLFATGVLMSLANFAVHRHYLIVLTPLLALAFSTLALEVFPRRAFLFLATYAVLQLGICVQALRFLERHHGAPEGDFGVSYADSPSAVGEAANP